MSLQRWYWGVVVRVDGAHELLAEVTSLTQDSGVRPQDPRTGHLTIFYAPLRSRRDAPALAAKIAAVAITQQPFALELAGFGEFASATRPVAWLGVTKGGDAIADLRRQLCRCDHDTHPHGFVPHLTLAYGEDPSAYEAIRGDLAQLAAAHRITAQVDSVWIAGFPLNGHPARDLRYVQQVPFGG